MSESDRGMNHALITGGCGFVGRHFAKRLLDDGWMVTVVDDMSSGVFPRDWAFRPTADGNFMFVYGDCRHWFEEVVNIFDLVIHCAAVVGGRDKIDRDPMAVAANGAIDSDFFRWLARERVNLQKVVYFSSSAVYPTRFQRRDNHLVLYEGLVGHDEQVFGMPDQTYGWAKLTGEYLAQCAVKDYGLDVVIYRPFSGYGEDQDLTYPFPSIVKRVVDGDDPVVVWGSGDQVRDFIHIDDIVEAVLSTKDKLIPGEVLNIGSGEGVSSRQLASMAIELVHSNICYPAVVCDMSKPEGVFYRVCDPGKMQMWYTPQVSLANGVGRAVAFMKKMI